MSLKVMVLGAGIFQVPLIKEVLKSGFEALVLSNRPKDPGMTIATKAFNISTTDKQSVLDLASHERIDAVVTCGSEWAMSTVGYVNTRLGLKGITENLAELICNKIALRKHLKSKGIRIPYYQVNESSCLAPTQVPFMLKPIRGGGSKGVSLWSQGRIDSENVILEQFIEGQELGGDCVVEKGRIAFLQVTRKKVNAHWVPFEHLIVDSANGSILLREYLDRIVSALELETGILNFDVIFDGEKYWLIDLGARMGGNCIPELIQIANGINEYQILLAQVLGLPYKINKHKAQTFCGVHIIGSEKKGVLVSYKTEKIEELEKDGNLIDFHLKYNKGDKVDVFDAGGFNAGYILFRADSEDRLNDVARNIAATLWMELD